jgi:hypothetical protein
LIQRQFRPRWKKRTDLHDVSGLQQEVDTRIVLHIRGALRAGHGYGWPLHVFRSQ